MKEKALARAGKLISIESGCYSDHIVIGFFVVLKDFDPHEELKRYLERHPEQAESYGFESDGYLAQLLQSGYLLELEYQTIHTDNYSKSDEFRFPA